MNPRLPIIALAAIIVATTGAAVAQQQSTYHKPMAPIGPTSDAQCEALEAEWTAICKRISDAHQQCLDANADPKIPGAKGCDKAPCLALHIENANCGGAERSSAVSSCRASVSAHKDREAQFKAAQDAAIRAQQEAERARKERFAAETSRYRAEEEAARRRKHEYMRNTPRPSANRPELDRGQASIVSDLRSEAERNAAKLAANGPLPGPEPMPAGPPPPPPPYEAIDNATMPAWKTPLEYVGELGKIVDVPGLKESREVLQWFSTIHDGRRAEAEKARDAFNESFRRDRPDDRNFKLDDCNQYVNYCLRVFDELSPETRRRFDDYMDKQGRYVAWTDLGNITGKGWTQKEQGEFMLSVGKTLTNKGAEQLMKWAKENDGASWDPKKREDISWTQDAVNKNLKKGLDKFFPAPKQPGSSAPPVNINEDAFERYKQYMKEWERQQRQPKRSEPNLLDEILRTTPTVPVSPPVGVPRG